MVVLVIVIAGYNDDCRKLVALVAMVALVVMAGPLAWWWQVVAIELVVSSRCGRLWRLSRWFVIVINCTCNDGGGGR